MINLGQVEFIYLSICLIFLHINDAQYPPGTLGSTIIINNHVFGVSMYRSDDSGPAKKWRDGTEEATEDDVSVVSACNFYFM